MNIESINISRSDDDGVLDPEGNVDITFHDSQGKIVATAAILRSGAVCAFVIGPDNKIRLRAVLNPGETEA